jgi:hypothetical protein
MFVVMVFVVELPSVTNKQKSEKCNVIFILSSLKASVLQHAEFRSVLQAACLTFRLLSLNSYYNLQERLR